MSENHELFISGDGSHTLISPIFQTSYHSLHGAIQESEIVFINAGLEYLKAKSHQNIFVFEMGFGTGLNAILAKIWAAQNNIKLCYHTVEAYPVPMEVIYKLNYHNIIGNQQDFIDLHHLSWSRLHTLSEYFDFCKWDGTLEEIELEPKFDAIFFDAFGPSTQPDLWNIGIMSKMYDMLNDGGVLTSFCAQGAFKRHLKSAGFMVDALPGPPGKREMTRAVKVKMI